MYRARRISRESKAICDKHHNGNIIRDMICYSNGKTRLAFLQSQKQIINLHRLLRKILTAIIMNDHQPYRLYKSIAQSLF